MASSGPKTQPRHGPDSRSTNPASPLAVPEAPDPFAKILSSARFPKPPSRGSLPDDNKKDEEKEEEHPRVRLYQTQYCPPPPPPSGSSPPSAPSPPLVPGADAILNSTSQTLSLIHHDLESDSGPVRALLRSLPGHSHTGTGPLVNSEVYFPGPSPVDKLLQARACAYWEERLVSRPDTDKDGGGSGGGEIPACAVHALLLLRILDSTLAAMAQMDEQGRNVLAFVARNRDRNRNRDGRAVLRQVEALVGAWTGLVDRLGALLGMVLERAAVVAASAREFSDRTRDRDPDPDRAGEGEAGWTAALADAVDEFRPRFRDRVRAIVDEVATVKGLFERVCAEMAREQNRDGERERERERAKKGEREEREEKV